MASPPKLATLSFQRAADSSVAVLRQAILEGDLAPGQRLKEEELAAQLGASRTPIRRALAVLEAEGLIVGAPHQGVCVRSYSLEEVDEFYRLRAVLEGHAAARAARAAQPRDVRELVASCDRLERMDPSVGLRAAIDENLAFHHRIVALAQGRELARMLRHVVALPVVYQTNAWQTEGQFARATEHHRAIAAAIAAHDDTGAERLMREHILVAKDIVLDRLAADGDTQGRR